MSKIIIGTAHGKKIGFDLDVLLPSRLLITSDSGGGKSWVMRVLQEQAFGKVQIITIDPEGEFATLREKFPFVLVGKGGETPADTRSAALVAQRLLQLRASAICDIYDMKPHLRHSWVRLFIEALIEAPKELRNPLLLIVDEAHVFGPEKGESEALGSMIDAATRGRKRGICLVCATQRLAMLAKDITSNLQNRLVGPTFEDVNRKRAGEMLGVLPGAPMREFFHQIQLLKPGNFFAFGRAIAEERTLVQVGPIQTTHPKAFGAKHTAPPPPTPEKILAMLPKLADLPKEAEDKARTEADFKREIRELKTKLTLSEKAQAQTRLAPAPQAGKPDPAQARMLLDMKSLIGEAVKIIAKINAIGFEGAEVKPEELQAALEKAAAEIGKVAMHKLAMKRRELENLKAEVNRLLSKLNAKLGDEKLQVSLDVVKNEPVSLRPSVPYQPHVREPRPLPANGSGSGLGKLAMQMAAIIAAYYPQPVKRSILAAMCGVKYGGHFSNNLSELRNSGLLEDVDQGVVKATEKCAQDFASTFEVPTTTDDVLRLWDPKLSDLGRRMVRELVKANGEPVSRNELAAALGVQYGGHFSNNLSDLRTAGLLVDAGTGRVAANKETLFLADDAA